MILVFFLFLIFLAFVLSFFVSIKIAFIASALFTISISLFIRALAEGIQNNDACMPFTLIGLLFSILGLSFFII